jgi:hypothetical protein
LWYARDEERHNGLRRSRLTTEGYALDCGRGKLMVSGGWSRLFTGRKRATAP